MITRKEQGMFKEIWLLVGSVFVFCAVMCVLMGSVWSVWRCANQVWKAVWRINKTYPAQINVPKGISIQGDGVTLKGCEIKSDGTAINIKGKNEGTAIRLKK